MRELKESVFLYSVLSILYRIAKLCDIYVVFFLLHEGYLPCAILADPVRARAIAC